MIDILRNQSLKTVVMGSVIVVTVLLFVVNWGPSMGGGRKGSVKDLLKDNCAANVVGSCVDLKTFRATTRMLLPRGDTGIATTQRAQHLAASALVERELLAREAERMGLTVTDDEVTDSILGGFIRVSGPVADPDNRSAQISPDGYLYAGFVDSKTKKFSEVVWKRSVRSLSGTSPVEFREWQQRELLAAKMRDIVQAPVRVSDEEALNGYVAEKSNASVSYILVKDKWAEHYVMTPPSQIAVEDWAKSNEPLVKGKEATIRHILIKSADSSDAGSEGKEKARAKAEEILTRLKKGEDFEKLARDYSQDTGSAMQGGDVGTKTDSFVENFKKAADGLKPGETVTAPVETQFGFHVIRKDDVARAAYLKAKSEEAAKNVAAKIHAAIKGGASPEDAVKTVVALYDKPAKAEKPAPRAAIGDAGAPPPAAPPMDTASTDPDHPTVASTSGFNRGGDAMPGLEGDSNHKLVEWSFNAKDNDLYAEPVRAHDGTAVIVQKTHKIASREDFVKEKESYTAALLAAKRREALSLYVRRLREMHKDNIKIDDNIFARREGDAGAAAPEPEQNDEGE